MANNANQQQAAAATKATELDTERLQEAAWELFVQRSPGGMRGPQAEMLARQCFVDAAAFARVAGQIDAGEPLAPVAKKGLDFAYAPNLKKTHPINLVSEKYGSINRVKNILDHLQKNPQLTELPEMPGESDLAWGLPEINTARTIFPRCLELAGAN